MTGFLNIFKEENASSTAAVNRIKWLTKTPCGHMGTLDPLACGVLPVGVGKATRLFDWFLNKQKKYCARFIFGATTETLDREGEVKVGGRVPTEAEIKSVLPQFIGDIKQVPPLYSAKSVNGRRGYELARAGEQFALPAKRIHIDSVLLTGQTAPNEFCFEIVCGGGTYIRSLARDIAAAVGTLGYMSYLKRTQSGVFTEETAVPLSKIDEKNVKDYLIPTDSVLPFPIFGEAEERLFHGVKVPVAKPDGQYKLYRGGAFYGILEVKEGLAKIGTKLC